MDGVLFDSMPRHAAAWEEVMTRHGFHFTAYDCYLNEGRTGQDVIREAILQTEHREPAEDELWTIYHEKADLFAQGGKAQPMPGVREVLDFLQAQGAQLWIVTGSGQQSLFDKLDHYFPGIFARERMITAFDVTHGKPDPEPYRKAYERSGLPIDQCCVVENAPLGVRSGKAAGLSVLAVNTGPLPDDLLRQEGADHVFPDMPALLTFLRQQYADNQ